MQHRKPNRWFSKPHQQQADFGLIKRFSSCIRRLEFTNSESKLVNDFGKFCILLAHYKILPFFFFFRRTPGYENAETIEQPGFQFHEISKLTYEKVCVCKTKLLKPIKLLPTLS